MSPLMALLRHCKTTGRCPLTSGGFNGSAQHLQILLDQEVADGDITDMVHGDAEGRAVGALEERVKCCRDLPGTGSEEQDWRSANCDAPWRNRAGAPCAYQELDPTILLMKSAEDRPSNE